MDTITKRLHENRQIELAKSILESAGYNVNKKLEERSKDDKYIIIGIKGEDNKLYYNADKGEFVPNVGEATVYDDYDTAVEDWNDKWFGASKAGFRRVFMEYADRVSTLEENTSDNAVSNVKKALDDAGIEYTVRGKNGDSLIVSKDNLIKASEIRDELGASVHIASRA